MIPTLAAAQPHASTLALTQGETLPTVLEIDIPHTDAVLGPRQIHGIACALFEGSDTEHTSQAKPWTAWPPQDTGSGLLTLRFTWLNDAVPLPAGALRALGGSLRIHRDNVVPSGARTRHVPYGDLASTAKASPIGRYRFGFHTPTFFSRGGRTTSQVDAFLVLSSLVRRWNENAPTDLAIPESTSRSLVDAAVLGHYDLETDEWSTSADVRRIGATGWADIQLARDCPPDAAAAMPVLCGAVEYLGVGKETTFGFGVVTAEPVDDDRDDPPAP